MGWSASGGNSKKSVFGFRNFKICSLHSVLGCSSDSRKSGDSDNRCLSQSLCPLLYNVCGSGESVGKGPAEVKKTIKGENEEPPDYYQQVICMQALQHMYCLEVYFAIVGWMKYCSD